MKYLNTYKLYESYRVKAGDVKLDCEEILLELKDIGFEVNITINNSWEEDFFDPNLYTIDWANVILRNDKVFSMEDVREYIERLSNYLKNFGLKKDRSNNYLIQRKNFRDPETFQIFRICWELDIVFTQNKL